MSGFSGANADSLELAGRELVASAGSVERIRTSLRSQLYTSHWEGPSADRYRQSWDSVHAPALGDAETFLRACGDRLAQNAREQRAASDGGGGVIGGTGATPVSGDSDDSEELRRLLESLGLSGELLDQLLAALGDIKDIVKILKAITDELDIDFLGAILGGASDVLDAVGKGLGYVDNIISFFTDFVGDFAENPDLPMDERMVHAIAESGMRLAVGAGAEAAADFATKALMSIVPGGAIVGAIVGPIVGEIVGNGVDMVVDAVDGQINLYDGTADGVTDAYRYAKEHDFNPGSIAVDQIGNMIDGAVDVAEDVGGAIIDGAGKVGDFIGGLF